jgi:RND family efflux transporter MFP subunit
MKARREVARAMRDQAQVMLDYTKIRAPFDGVITKRCVDVGHFVQPASASTKGEPLLAIDRRDKIRIFVHVPELEALWINRELAESNVPQARIHSDGLGGRVLKGTLTRSSFALDPRTRTLRAEIDFDNRDGLLRSGMFVNASIPLERKNVWTLPASALQKNEGLVRCYRVEAGKAKSLPLLVGLEGGGLVEILKKQAAASEGWDDVKGDEEILSTLPAGITDGTAVR